MPLSLSYRSDSGGLVDDFYVPCLTASVEYLRAVGYFTSRSLAIVAAGIPAFLANGGHVKLVASPQLERADVDAMSAGYERRLQIVEGVLERALQPATVDDIERERLGFLAWMVAVGQLDIRVAIRADYSGIYHEKFGVFIDALGDAVMFTGSPNETVGGLVNNFESIDVFTSWEDSARVAIKRVAFNALWLNKTQGVAVVPLPEAVRQRLLTYAPDRRPMRDPLSKHKPVDPLPTSGSDDERLGVPGDVHPRPYQLEAIERWQEAGNHGVWEMATGTGKTLTALMAAATWATGQSKVLLVVAAPLKHLVDQWADQMERFGLDPIKCRDSVASWSVDLRDRLDLLRLGLVNVVSCVVTHQTLGSAAFMNAVEHQAGDAARLLIADEVHHLGAEIRAEALSDAYTARLGLSATPRRWNDEAGDERIEDFFGPIVFQFTLQEAIAQGYLTRYEYRPILVELDDEEMDQYIELTRDIVDAWQENRDDSTKNALLRKRSELLNSAHGKLEDRDAILAIAEEYATGGVDILRQELTYSREKNLERLAKLALEVAQKTLPSKVA